jgi:DNA-binding MarR family transcriptional regulator
VTPATPRDLADEDYRRLLALRTRLRGFLQWSEQQAGTAGLSPSQHQLLLAVRGHDDPRGPTIGEVADYLLLRHHSAVGLVDRATEAGLVRRVADDRDGRVTRVRLTGRGGRLLQRLSAVHLAELGRLASHLQPLLAGLETEVTRDDHGGSRMPPSGSS